MNIRQKVAWINLFVIPAGLFVYYLLLQHYEWRIARIVMLPTILIVSTALITELLKLRAARKRNEVTTDERDRIIILQAIVLALSFITVAMVLILNVTYHFAGESLVLSISALRRIMLMVPVYCYLAGVFVYSAAILKQYGRE